MLRMWSILAVALAAFSSVSAQTLDELYGILQSETDRIADCRFKVRKDVEIVYDLSSPQIARRRELVGADYECSVKNGKVFVAQTHDDRVESHRMAWNGETYFASSEGSGAGYNNISSHYYSSAPEYVSSILELGGISFRSILGDLDMGSRHEQANLFTPLMLLHRYVTTGERESDYVDLEIEDAVLNETHVIRLSRVIIFSNIPGTTLSGSAVSTVHYLDPAMCFGLARFENYRLLPEEGKSILLSTVDVSLTMIDGVCVPEEVVLTNNVGLYANDDDAGEYPVRDYEKSASVSTFVFSDWDINSGIDDTVFGPSNVFVPSLATYDLDSQRFISKPFDEVESDILADLEMVQVEDVAMVSVADPDPQPSKNSATTGGGSDQDVTEGAAETEFSLNEMPPRQSSGKMAMIIALAGLLAAACCVVLVKFRKS